MTELARDRFDLVPSEAAETAFLNALDRDRLHHAWLLCGPEGSGKATFAYRAARRLMQARPDPSRGPLGTRPDDPVARLISAQAHPDLLVLERAVEGGKTRKSISVDQARDLPEFFAKSPSQSPYRVAIIDSADDLNLNAANALLKVLEEPPPRGVLFLISHAPGRLLPTIRSRCRRLAFTPWTQPALSDLLERRAALPAVEAERIAGLAGGSPGRALDLASGATLEMDRLARQWVAEPSLDRAEALAIVDGFRGAEGANRFDTLMERLRAAVLEQARGAPAGQGAPWSDLWSRLGDLSERVSGLNLDRGDALLSALTDVGRTRARAC